MKGGPLMKKTILSLLACAVMAPSMAAAQSNNNTAVNVAPGTTLRELPGNAYIVEGNNSNNNTIIIRDGRSIWYRTLFNGDEPYPHPRPNYAPQSAVNDACGGDMSVSKRNKCIGDVIKAQEDLRKKYR